MTVPRVGRAVVVGTGTMAPQIAAALADQGSGTPVALSVTICGRRATAAQHAAQAAHGLGAAMVQAAALESRTFVDADIVIETVIEDMEVKRDLLATISVHCPAETLIATNTSSLSISKLAEAVRLPERFVGLHFLNPASQTTIAEVAPGAATTAGAIDRAAALVRDMGKQPIVLGREINGFVWNRIQFAVLRECLHLLDEGVADAEEIDLVVSAGLAPRWLAAGPFATVDLGGTQTFLRASQQLFPQLSSTPEVSARLVQHDACGTTFRGWPAQSRAQVTALRAEALAMARSFDGRRSDAMRGADWSCPTGG